MLWVSPRFKRCWKSMKIADAGALNIPGWKRRAWYSTHEHFLDNTREVEPRMKADNIFSYVLVAYTKGNEAMFEFRYRNGYCADPEKSMPIPHDVVAAMVAGLNGVSGYGFENLVVENMGGRALVHTSSTSLCKDAIYRSTPGYLCDSYGAILAFMIRYQDTVKTYADAEAVRNAMKTLNENICRISCSGTSDKDCYLKRIADTQRDLEKCNATFDVVCNDAADAINELVDEFGIEINI